MKKLKYFFAAIIVVVLMAVPAFAADSCEHISDRYGSDVVVYLYDDFNHYCYCSICDVLISASDLGAPDGPHSGSSCQFCFGFGFSIDLLPAFRCSVLHGFFFPSELTSFEDIAFVLQGDSHFLCCVDCGTVLDISLLGFPPHVDAECEVCMDMISLGIPILDSFPSGSSGVNNSEILPSASALATAAISWLSAFAFCIVSNPLLLVFVVCVFVGLGIGLIKRTIHL